MAIINTTFSTNETQLENGLRDVYITWYLLVGLTGVLGNTFVLVVFFQAKRLRTAKLVVSWLAFVDLFGCLTIPFRYLILFEADKLLQPLCIAIPPILHFSGFLTLFALVVAAIERYRAVRFVNKLQNDKKDNTIVFVIIAFSVLLALLFGTMSRFQVQLDKYENGIFYCTPVSQESFNDSSDIMEKVTSTLAALIIFCSIFLITVLYVKIALILRRRIAVPSPQRQPNCSTINSIEHNSTPFDDEDEDSKSFQSERWDGIFELCETLSSPNLESKEVVGINGIKPIMFSIINTDMTEKQHYNHSTKCLKMSQSASPLAQDIVLPRKASAMILPHVRVTSNARHSTNLSANTSTSAATTSKALSHSQSQAVKITPKRAAATDPSVSLALRQLPGAVLEDKENLSTLNSLSKRPRQLSLVSAGNEEAAIPTLEECSNHKRGLQMITKTTLMLFTATVMCIVTYGFVAIFVMLSESSKAGDFVLEFMLIIHVINPFVYNFVNEGFRDECKDFFKKIKFRCCFQR